jgi:hypothetical protein
MLNHCRTFPNLGRDGGLPNGVPEWRDGLCELTTRGAIFTLRAALNSFCAIENLGSPPVSNIVRRRAVRLPNMLISTNASRVRPMQRDRGSDT